MNHRNVDKVTVRQGKAKLDVDVGVIGLAVMGQNLVLNMADHGFSVSVFNRTSSKTDEFTKGISANQKIFGFHDLHEFVVSLRKPRRILLMVKAGAPVDEIIEQLIPFVQAGDILIDGGNSFYLDTQRRFEELRAKGILYVGTGISGGEEGARHGPSMMPGGDVAAWPHVKPLFQAIAAKADQGEPCCDWVGSGGAGHYVKMIHNGIEYGDLQLICETYHLLHVGFGVSYPDLAHLFDEWNRGVLSSYLIEITAEIFRKKDADGSYVLDHILDVAGQKGTGKWTSTSALDLDVPVTLIAESVYARFLSTQKEEREQASRLYTLKRGKKIEEMSAFCQKVAQALYVSKIISYAQGFALMRKASASYGWDLQFGAIALMWRAGCIIRSKFLGKIKEAFQRSPDLPNLLLDPFFVQELTRGHEALREVVATGALVGIPLPCMSAALSFFDGYTCGSLPANLLQAQRDFFGAHTYERIDARRGAFFHTNWTGTGGEATSSSYSV